MQKNDIIGKAIPTKSEGGDEMHCEVRKSCSLRNVVYDIAKLSSPVGIVLIDTTEIVSTELFKSPREKFWQELKMVFREVGQAYEYTLEEDIKAHRASTASKNPIVLELGTDQIFVENHLNGVMARLQALKIRRIVVVCIVYGLKGAVYADKITANLTIRDDPAKQAGADTLIIVDEEDK